jgi:hypothetical protein
MDGDLLSMVQQKCCTAIIELRAAAIGTGGTIRVWKMAIHKYQ